ncbi:MAG TPA: hypothetical protein VM032_08810 [Vicinamibacterales bacterium]|nr:hypothetical protein [Vicinamibacterales bacterium]
MSRSSGSRRRVPAAVIGALSCVLVSSVFTAAQGGADAAAHKQWMNDASDAQEDFRFAVSGKDQKLAVEALGKLEGLMTRTEEYWAARKAADGVRFASEARALAHDAAAAATSGNLSAAGEAFAKMGTACNACHDLHLERK